ncbi:MAG: hypothetical protein VCC04_05875, partial [Myxococcota bacterium]
EAPRDRFTRARRLLLPPILPLASSGFPNPESGLTQRRVEVWATVVSGSGFILRKTGGKIV